jgi:hypothetical protein
MKYISIILEFLPKKAIAIYLLKKAKKHVQNTENTFDNLSYEILLATLFNIGLISEKEAINNEL